MIRSKDKANKCVCCAKNCRHCDDYWANQEQERERKQ